MDSSASTFIRHALQNRVASLKRFLLNRIIYRYRGTGCTVFKQTFSKEIKISEEYLLLCSYRKGPYYSSPSESICWNSTRHVTCTKTCPMASVDAQFDISFASVRPMLHEQYCCKFWKKTQNLYLFFCKILEINTGRTVMCTRSSYIIKICTKWCGVCCYKT